MQNQSRSSLIRRLLLPYSGEERLTRRQGWRLVLTWALFFALVLSIAILPVVVLLHVSSISKLAVIVLLTFLFTALLFGATACFVVVILNRSVDARLKWKEQHAASSKQH